jgi:drug/metabolite transporter (DMT)-like permease
MTSQRQASYQRRLALPLLAVLFGREALAAAPQLSGQNWFWLLWMGGISSGLAYVFYYKFS